MEGRVTLMAMAWYVICAVAGRESKVKEAILTALKQANLQAKLEEMLIPVERVTEVKRGRRTTAERKIFPGYIYVRMEIAPDVLEVINNVEGVIGFLGADPQQPDSLTAEEAERIIRIAKADSVDEQRAALVQIPFKVHDRVKIREGTFAGMEGEIEEINSAKGTIRVGITVFNRKTPIELEVWQVEETG